MSGASSFSRGNDRRGAPRYKIERTVWIVSPRLPSVEGVLVNLSLTGCAVRVPQLSSRRPWPLSRISGDELSLWQLLRDPVPCWVVAVDQYILRLRFQLNATMRLQLEQAISNWADRKPENSGS